MCSDVILSVQQLSKTYRVYAHPQDRLKQFFWRGRRQFFREFSALHPISFDLSRGECLGIIGRNGSGKSTLLQLVTGTLNPTSGSYSVKGKVSALLELGAGFNPEFTGRENVYLNGSILGLTRAEVESRFSDIEDFAEIGSFIDQPVKTYSSGMYIRLAFSVAIHVQPDLLFVDEALAVGDAAFQYKCMRKIEELRQQGMSILFVTHDTGAVKKLCDRALWIHDGNSVSLGPATDVVHQYEDFMRTQMNLGANGDAPRARPDETPDTSEANAPEFHAKLVTTELVDSKDRALDVVLTGTEIKLRIAYEVYESPKEGIIIGAAIFRADDLYVCALNTRLDSFVPECRRGRHEIDLVFSSLGLLAGSYYVKTGVFDSTGMVRWDFDHRACSFTVTSPYLAEGVVLLPHQWSQR